MSGISKRVSGSWVSGDYGIMKTATDTITTLPADIYANDTTATVGISGNMEQNGTPTTDNPIMPEGTGDKTGNLWNEEGFSARDITSTHKHTDTNTYGTTLSTTIGKETIITQSEYPTGTVGYQNGFFFIDVDFSKYEIGDTVTLSFDYICNEVHSIEGQISTTLYAGKNNNSIPVVLSSGKWSVSGRLTAVITVIADMKPYVEVRLCGNSITVKNIMLNTGSTALPFEPFGVKIPISSANTTTPVYLGEVESTRQIRKLEFTGDTNESWRRTGTGRFAIVLADTSLKTAAGTCLCSHYIGTNKTSISDISDGECTTRTTDNEFICYDTAYTTVDTYKAWLAQQYAAGTPVCVWYVLANETTGIVNEPLRKIGDYADTVSGISIPTITGANTLSVDTTLQPSEVTVNYKGWHPVADVHEKSKNLFDKDRTNDIVDNSYINISGKISTNSGYYMSYPIYLTVGETYTWRFDNVQVHSAPTIGFYDNSNNLMGVAPHDASVTNFSFTVPSGCAYVKCSVYKSLKSEAMLNTGSTALPYEPYWK